MPPNIDFCTRAAAVSGAKPGTNGPSTINEAARTVGVTLATENPVQTWDWDMGRVGEVLLMSGATYPAQVPLLDSHNRYSVNAQLGSLRDLQISGTSLQATACFADVPSAVDTFSKVRDGHLTDISVGYICDDVLKIAEGETANVEGREFTGPLRVVRKWTVKEGSMTPIGADELAKVRSAMALQTNTPEENTMPPIINDPQQRGTASGQPLPCASAAPAAPVTADPNAGQRSEISTTPAGAPLPQAAPATSVTSGAGDSSRAALAEIVNLGARHGCIDLAEQYILEGRGVDAFRAAVLDRIGGQAERNAPAHHVAVGETDMEKFRAAASDSIILRSTLGSRIEKPAPGALEMRGYSLRELARECCRRSGLRADGDIMEVVGRALTSSSDYQYILGDSAHRAVRLGATEANETFPLWAGEASATDFREHTGVSLDSFSTLDLVPEGSEYKHGQTSDSGVVYSVATYGKLFSITRQAIIDDNLQVFTRVPAGMGRAAMRTVGNIVWAILLNNPQLKDGNALFSAAHKNIAAVGAAPDVTTYDAAVVAMGTHTNKDGDALNITPKFMLVPAVYNAKALQLLRSTSVGTAEQPNMYNPYQNAVQPIQDGRIDVAGVKKWFVVADKGQNIDVAWLGGNKTPRIEQRNGWNVDGVEYKISIDAGAYVADWHGLYENPGE